MWSLAVFARALGRDEPRLLRRALVLAALAAATKDQAYAMFLFALPIAFAMSARRAWKEAAIAVGLAGLVLLVTDAVIFNPSGFAFECIVELEPWHPDRFEVNPESLSSPVSRRGRGSRRSRSVM